jgi:hypothetical protein
MTQIEAFHFVAHATKFVFRINRPLDLRGCAYLATCAATYNNPVNYFSRMPVLPIFIKESIPVFSVVK